MTNFNPNANSKYLFNKYQRLLLQFSNTQLGRDYLGIKEKEPILKICPNSYHWFLEKTKSEIWIKSKFYGKNIYQEKLGLGLTTLDILHSFDPKALLHYLGLRKDPFVYPTFLFTTTNYSLSAGQGGIIYNASNSWATTHDSSSGLSTGYWTSYCDKRVDNTYTLTRIFMPFDNTSLPSDAIISDGKLYICQANGGTKYDDDNIEVDLVQSYQASPTSLNVSDYSKTYNVVTGSYDITSIPSYPTFFNITMDATGLGWIQKGGYTLLAVKGSKDTDNIAPSGRNSFDLASGADLPYLAVTYTIPSGAFLAFF